MKTVRNAADKSETWRAWHNARLVTSLELAKRDTQRS